MPLGAALLSAFAIDLVDPVAMITPSVDEFDELDVSLCVSRPRKEILLLVLLWGTPWLGPAWLLRPPFLGAGWRSVALQVGWHHRSFPLPFFSAFMNELHQVREEIPWRHALEEVPGTCQSRHPHGRLAERGAMMQPVEKWASSWPCVLPQPHAASQGGAGLNGQGLPQSLQRQFPHGHY